MYALRMASHEEKEGLVRRSGHMGHHPVFLGFPERLDEAAVGPIGGNGPVLINVD